MHSQQAAIVALFQFQHLIKKDVVLTAAKTGLKTPGGSTASANSDFHWHPKGLTPVKQMKPQKVHVLHYSALHPNI